MKYDTMNVYLHTKHGAEILESQPVTLRTARQVGQQLAKVALQASCNGQKTSVGVASDCGTFYLDGEKLMSVMVGR